VQKSVIADSQLMQIKIGTSDKPLSPELVEYPANSLWKDVGLQGFRSRYTYSFLRENALRMVSSVLAFCDPGVSSMLGWLIPQSFTLYEKLRDSRKAC